MVEIIMPKKDIKKTISVPGDKSISHRSIMIGAIANGLTEVEGFLPGDDCLKTIECFQRMGIQIERHKDRVKVHGKGLRSLKEPPGILDAGNSGTTIRLLSGILAGQGFTSCITGDESLQRRPMKRIIDPLRQMGAQIESAGDNLAPLTIKGGGLKGIAYKLPVASAQVKSAVLLAGLYAQGETFVMEPSVTRDHTECMLHYFGANIHKKDRMTVIRPGEDLHGNKVKIPGDFSSAAYLLAAGLLCSNSEITITGVGVNPTRTGLITALRQMGAEIGMVTRGGESGEDTADITVRTSQLAAVEISGDLIALMIDEIPIFAVCALFAKGTTVIKDAAELKVKESDRIGVMVGELKKFGADITETHNGMVIEGGARLRGCHVDCHGDHRIAMSLAVCALKAEGETHIHGAECCNISYPGFFKMLNTL